MTRKPTKPYWKMTRSELREATKRFDKPIPPSKLRPLTKDERARFKRSRRGPDISLFGTRGGKVLAIVRDGELEMLTQRPPKWLLKVQAEYGRAVNSPRSASR